MYKFNRIDTGAGNGRKDFGNGFYTTRTKKHAYDIVFRNIARNGTYNTKAYVYSMSIESEILESFKCKEFKDANNEWLEFILMNRKSDVLIHGYDVVIGPTADDGVRDTLAMFERRVYKDRKNIKLYKEMAIAELKADVLPRQTFFANNMVAQHIVIDGVEIMDIRQLQKKVNSYKRR